MEVMQLKVVYCSTQLCLSLPLSLSLSSCTLHLLSHSLPFSPSPYVLSSCYSTLASFTAHNAADALLGAVTGPHGASSCRCPEGNCGGDQRTRTRGWSAGDGRESRGWAAGPGWARISASRLVDAHQNEGSGARWVSDQVRAKLLVKNTELWSNC